MKAHITISHGDTPLGTLRITLRPDIVPRTVDNFVHFLTSPKSGSASGSGNDATNGYQNSTFHRIIPKFMAQVNYTSFPILVFCYSSLNFLPTKF